MCTFHVATGRKKYNKRSHRFNINIIICHYETIRLRKLNEINKTATRELFTIFVVVIYENDDA